MSLLNPTTKVRSRGHNIHLVGTENEAEDKHSHALERLDSISTFRKKVNVLFRHDRQKLTTSTKSIALQRAQVQVRPRLPQQNLVGNPE